MFVHDSCGVISVWKWADERAPTSQKYGYNATYRGEITPVIHLFSAIYIDFPGSW